MQKILTALRNQNDALKYMIPMEFSDFLGELIGSASVTFG